MTTTIDDKRAIRAEIFKRRKTAHGLGLDQEANAHLLALLKTLDPATIVASYMPIRTELSPLEAMSQTRLRLCVPVVIEAGQALEFHAWTPDCDMVEGAFGAAIPKSAQILVPDVVIAPLVGFDPRGNRLGYGGGFYDRSFEAIAKTKPVLAVGFAYSAQEVENLPVEPTDHRLDMMITEKGLRDFRNSDTDHVSDSGPSPLRDPEPVSGSKAGQGT